MAADKRTPLVAVVLLIGLASALLLFAGRGNWFFIDDWAFAMGRWDLSADTIFLAQNRNCCATVVLIYRAMFELFGLSDYLPWRLLLTATIAGIGALMYIYARRRVGPWWALVAVALVIVTPGYEIALWPFQVGQALSVLCGLGASVLLDQESNARRLTAVALLLVISLASSSAGVPLVAVVIADRLLQPGRRRDLLAVVPGVLFYLWWFAAYGSDQPADNPTNAAVFAGSVDRAFAIGNSATQELLGLGSRGQVGLLIGQIAFAVLAVVVAWRVFGPYCAQRARVTALAAGAITYWLLLAWGRPFVAVETSPRYLFLSQVLLVLLLVDVARAAFPAYADARARARRVALPLAALGACVIGVVAALAVLHNSRTERLFGAVQRNNADYMRGQVYGLGLLRPADRQRAMVYLGPGYTLASPATNYFDTLERFGEKPAGEADVVKLSPAARRFTDQTLFAVYLQPGPVKSVTASGKTTPELVSRAPQTVGVTARRGCLNFAASGQAPATIELPGLPRGYVVRSSGPQPVVVKGRRYASDWEGQAAIAVPSATALAVRLPEDLGDARWRVQVTGARGQVCSL